MKTKRAVEKYQPKTAKVAKSVEVHHEQTETEPWIVASTHRQRILAFSKLHGRQKF